MEYLYDPACTLVRLERGEEVVSALLELFPRLGVPCVQVSGLGAVGEVETGLFLTAEKRYVSRVRRGDMEIVSLLGTIANKGDAPYAHLHMSVADASGAVTGGHLNRAVVSATAELVLRTIPHAPGRVFSPEIGLNLWSFAPKTKC